MAPTSPKIEPLLPVARITLSAELLLVPDALTALPVAVAFDPLSELTLLNKETDPDFVAEAPDAAEPDAEAEATSLTTIRKGPKRGLR
jgi:hypothetical protein